MDSPLRALLRPHVLYPLFLLFLVVTLIFTRAPRAPDGRKILEFTRRRISLSAPSHIEDAASGVVSGTAGDGALDAVADATGEANPRVVHVAFDPLVAEVEQQRDDRAWERRYARLHGARKPFRVHSDDPRKHHLHGEGVGVGDEEADDGTLEGSELAEFEEERARYRDEADDAMWGELDGQHHEFTEDDLRNDHLNLSHRLALLFPLLDTSPPDGRVSQSELATWLLAVERAASLHRTRREMEAVDSDADGRITLDEALEDELADQAGSSLTLLTVLIFLTHPCPKSALTPFLLLVLTSHCHSPPGLPAPVHHGEGGWQHVGGEEQRRELEQRFHVADADGDGHLSLTELNSYLHPEDSDDPSLRNLTLLQEFRERDSDNDSRISLAEFKATLFHELMAHDDDTHDPVEALVHLHAAQADKDKWTNDHRRPHRTGGEFREALEEKERRARGRFEELDKDGDGFLSPGEFELVLRVLWPSERDFAELKAADMIRQADNNGDGYLQLDEMQEHSHVFYNSVHAHEQQREHVKHEEL
ncbi:unnamed protein product [Closterium sp. NIES-64]|nr:unnamed protein product [Closterium sp. NIES-64]